MPLKLLVIMAMPGSTAALGSVPAPDGAQTNCCIQLECSMWGPAARLYVVNGTIRASGCFRRVYDECSFYISDSKVKTSCNLHCYRKQKELVLYEAKSDHLL
ncbi:zinc finger C2HC domain-containing protein 1C [Platysternon megacephalum]|uniref:Zinc finger C2HC domain-containing protein 1C n=1 Tax=Platysternon megacephalum TaxID=55544 RepID=A0A4D9EQV0_9SAUR|nr:zinc finger C2HC domain-containing protein 1C [Platysternon megacephalum]